jgi:hypothetical protein
MNTLSSSLWFLDYIVYTTENSTTTVDIEQGSGGGAETNLGLIIGGAVSGFIVLALLIAGVVFAVLRQRRVKLKRGAKEAAISEEELIASTLIVPFTNPTPSTNQTAAEPPDSPYVSPGPGGIMMAIKYNRASAGASTSTTRLLNPVPEDSVYTGIGTSTYTSISEHHHTSTAGESLPSGRSQTFE